MPSPSYTGQPGEAGASASSESPTAEQKTPPKKKRRGETQPKAREVTGKKIKKKQKKRKNPKEPGKEQKKESHVVDKLVDKLLPGSSKYIPDWAKPIVVDVKGKSVDPDRVEAFVAQDGTLVVHAVMDPAKSGHAHGGILSGLAASFEENEHDEEPDGIEMLLTVEDPSQATKKDPAQVEVTAVDPETDEAVTKTAEVTKPKKADDVAEKAIKETLAEVATPATAVAS